jgi:hypothetical protein
MLRALEIVAVLAAVVFAVALLCLIVLYSSPPSNEPKQQQSSEKYEPGQKKRELSESFWQRTTHDPVAFFTLWLAIFTMILSAVAVIQIKFLVRGEGIAANTAQAAKNSADVAKQTLISAQRAWIRIDQIGLGGGGLAIDKNGASVSISFKITNIGNSPALNVSPYAWLVVIKSGGPFPLQEQQRRCEEIRNQPMSSGVTLFPNESFPSNIGVSGWSLGTNASREDIEKGAEVSADKKQIMLSVVGCIDYTFPTDPTKHHQTGFVLGVMRDVMFPTVVLEDGIIPIDRLSLMDSWLGHGRFAD